MFEVLAFVYDSYWSGPHCPALPTLHRELNALDFDTDEVLDALVWLEDLQSAAHSLRPTLPAASAPRAEVPVQPAQPTTMRVLTEAEQARIGCAGWGLLAQLVQLGSLGSNQLEVVLERAMAATGSGLALEDLKLIVLMVFWSQDTLPDTGLSDALMGDGAPTLRH